MSNERNQAIISLMPIARKAIKGLGARTLDKADLLSEATIGLIKAVDSYDASKGASLATHAYNMARQTALRAVQSAAPMGVGRSEIGRKLFWQGKSPVQAPLSLDAPMGEDGEASLHDLVGSADPDQGEKEAIERIADLAASFSAGLSPSERFIFEHKVFPVNEKESLSAIEIAETLQISRQYVHRIENQIRETFTKKAKALIA